MFEEVNKEYGMFVYSELKLVYIKSVDFIWDVMKFEVEIVVKYDLVFVVFMYLIVINVCLLEDCVIYWICEWFDYFDM